MPFDPELDNGNAVVAVTGQVAVAPFGAVLPGDAEVALDDDFDGLGLIGEDGVVESTSTSTTKIKAWQNARTVRTVVTEAECTIKFKMLETKRATVELYFGSAVDPTTGSLIFDPGETGGRKTFIVDVVDGNDFIRTEVPEGEVTERGDITNAAGEVVGYEVTITCYVSKPEGWDRQGAVRKHWSALKGVSAGG